MDSMDLAQFENPLISVVIPVYNAEKFLDQCLFSLKYQTFPRFEVLCVDDGSTDRSVEIIKRYAESDSRFKLLSQTHQFAGVARNLGIKNAKGEYLLFLDADDYFAPNLLIDAYYQAKLFDAEICVFGANYFDEKESKTGEMSFVCNFMKCEKNTVFSKETNLDNIFSFTSPAPWSKLFKRNFILDKEIYFQDTRNANDVSFVLTALAEANRIVALDKSLVYYRVNHGTSLQQTKESDPTCICDALSSLKTELINRNLFEKLKKPYCNVAVEHCFYNLRTLQSRQAFECLYQRIKEFLTEDLHLSEVPESFITSIADKEGFFDIGRLTVEDYMQKYELFGMKKPSELVEEPEVKDSVVDNKIELEPVVERLCLHQRAYNYYRINGFRATCKKIFLKLSSDKRVKPQNEPSP